MGNRVAPGEAKPEDSIQVDKLTTAQLQEELSKRSLSTEWNPLKGKKVLVERLQASTPVQKSYALLSFLLVTAANIACLHLMFTWRAIWQFVGSYMICRSQQAALVQKHLDARKEERTAALVGHQALQDMRGAVEAAHKRISTARESLKEAQDASRKAAAAAEDPPPQVCGIPPPVITLGSFHCHGTWLVTTVVTLNTEPHSATAVAVPEISNAFNICRCCRP